jgi:hypothetical protein
MDLPEFQGGNPYFLMFVDEFDIDLAAEPPYQRIMRSLVIDLDESGWMAKHGHIFTDIGDMHLVRKTGQVIVLSVHLDEGDQGYYVARHVGTTSHGETIAYGIGKKTRTQRKGTWHDNEDKLWVLAWGQVCGGGDVEYFALDGLKKGRA